MYKLAITKENNQITFDHLRETITIMNVDCALRSICLYLKENLTEFKKAEHASNGFISITIEDEEDENGLNTKVLFEHKGFDFAEIRFVLNLYKEQFPPHFKSRFMYHVDFNNLSVKW